VAFGNDAEEYRLHLHFRQGGWCSRDELLERVEWDRGEYFVSGNVEFFAHFMRRDVGGEGNGPCRAAARAQSPESMSVRQVLALPVSGGGGSVTPESALYSPPEQMPLASSSSSLGELHRLQVVLLDSDH
jgi:hypothetical protein